MIFKNINSEDIPGLIICSEPSISSSAIRTKETTIDGRDGTIVEKLGYKTRIKNVEIGLKKDANVDKILSYFSGEGDLIFKNENDKVYKAAIYEQVDLERLLRLRKGSVAFYCQPFKYKRNDIFETIKDNKVKEKKGKHLELLNCAEQNVVDLKLEGSTTQATRSGKNLFNLNNIRNAPNVFTVTETGVNLTNDWGGDVFTFENIAKTFKANTTYTMKAKAKVVSRPSTITDINDNIFLFYRPASDELGHISKSILEIPDKRTIALNTEKEYITSFTTPEDMTNVRFLSYTFRGNNDGSTTGTALGEIDVSEIMLVEGSYTAETFPEYEQYGASPSPDYPAKIENVEGNVEIKDIGENLLDVTAKTTTKQGITLTVNADKSITINGTNTGTGTAFFKLADNFVLPAGDYTLSNKNANASVQGFLFYDDGKNFSKTNISNATFTEDTTISPYIRIVAGVTINNQTIYPMIIKGTYTEETIPVYKPYQEQKITFPLSEEQKLYKDSYLASDGIYNKRKQVVYNGTENWAFSPNKVCTFIKTLPSISKTGICTHYKSIKTASVFGIDTGIYLETSNSAIISDPRFSTIDEFKTYLQEQYSNGTPVTVEYELATEEIVPYTTAQQEAYNQLQKLKLYKGQNTMFSLEGSIINLKYLEDTDEKVENQGNIYSKPIIRLEKTVFKEVEIAINGIRFKYNFEEDDYVEIDCEEMTVQYEGLDRNRRLVIDFEFPKLKEGNNDIVMYSGDCIIKCKRKDRWL